MKGSEDGCYRTVQQLKLIEICSNPIAWYDSLSPEEKSTALRCAVSGNVATFTKLLGKALQDVSRDSVKPARPVEVNINLLFRTQGVFA
jgi:hypothetical protein